MTNEQPSGGEHDPFTILDRPEAGRYELRDGDTPIGFARYSDHGDSLVFTHTAIDDAYEGRGLGSRLARYVLTDAVARNKRIVPACPFIAAYLKRHHDYDAQVDWPDGS